MSKRLQVELSEKDYERLRELAAGRPLADLVRRALNAEAFLQERERAGAKVLIEESDGTQRELVRL